MLDNLINYVGEHIYQYIITLDKKKKSIDNLIKANTIYGDCEKCNACNIISLHEIEKESNCKFCSDIKTHHIEIPNNHKNIEEYATNKILYYFINENEIQKQMYIYRHNYQGINYCSICFDFYWRDKEKNEYIELLAKEFPNDSIDYSKIYDDDYNFPAATCFICEKYFCGFCDPYKYGELEELEEINNCDCHKNDCLSCQSISIFLCFTCVPK